MKFVHKLAVLAVLATPFIRSEASETFESYSKGSLNQQWTYTAPYNCMIVTRAIACGAVMWIPPSGGGGGYPPEYLRDGASMMGLVAGPLGLVHQAVANASSGAEITDEKRTYNCAPATYMIQHAGGCGTTTGFAYVRGITEFYW